MQNSTQSTITVLNCASSIASKRQYNSLADALFSTKKKNKTTTKMLSFFHSSIQKNHDLQKTGPSCSKGGQRYPVDNAIGFPDTYPVGW